MPFFPAGFVGARPLSQRDIMAQERADAMNRDFWERNQIAADRRDQGRVFDTARADAIARDEAERQQARYMLERQQAEAAQQAQIARDWEYQTATNPELRQARMNERNMNENYDADRQANLIMTQGRANAFVNTERMQDQRQLALTQAQLDAVATMQKGNIDARLLSLQGQNAQSLAGVNNEFAIKRDAAQSGNAMNEDAWSRMQNRKAALMEMEGIEKQKGVSLPQPDQEKRDALWEEYRRIEDLVENKQISVKQALSRADEIMRKMGQFRATIKQIPWNQSPETLGSIIKGDPTGQFGFTRGANGEAKPFDFRQKATGAAKTTDPEKRDADRADELGKTIKQINDELRDVNTKPEDMPSRQEIQTEALRRLNRLPPSDPINMPAPRQVVPVPMGWSDQPMRSRMPGPPTPDDQPDPRMAAVTGSQGPPPQQMRPGLPGPVDPRMMPQGQPAQAPAAPARQPFVGQNLRTGEPPQGQPVAPPEQQAAAALQIFTKLTANGFPKPGTEEERLVMEAAAYLKKNGIDPTGGARRPAPRPSYPGRSIPLGF